MTPAARRIARPLVWLASAGLVALPLLVAGTSPLQEGREPIWILGGLAGVAAMPLLVIQGLLPTGRLARLAPSLRWHRVLGYGVLLAVLVHVGALYLYSPEDITDALLFLAPAYSKFGVIAAWCLVFAVLVAVLRRRLGLGHATWRIVHGLLALITVGTAVAHTVMAYGAFDGVVETLTCVAALLATSLALLHQTVLAPWRAKARG